MKRGRRASCPARGPLGKVLLCNPDLEAYARASIDAMVADTAEKPLG